MPLGDLVCFSHLRWDFVYQRPQHLMSRASRQGRVIFVEELERRDDAAPHVEKVTTPEGVRVYRPVVSHGLGEGESLRLEQHLVAEVLEREEVETPVVWHYTPMTEPLSRDIDAAAVVYDCMDELASFRFAPTNLRSMEAALMRRADLVFTGGQSLYRAKKGHHPSVHAFPSGVDAAHFRQATATPRPPRPADLTVPGPVLMYVGVLDERVDMQLIDAVAARRPDWSVVLVGPVLKIAVSDVSTRDNIVWLGMKSYAELPAYLAHADVAVMPFARNDATKYISPTKTLEYLAAGLSVVSTPILDVVQPYGNLGLVRTADDPDRFVEACEAGLRGLPPRRAVDRMQAQASWDAIWERMAGLIDAAMEGRLESTGTRAAGAPR